MTAAIDKAEDEAVRAEVFTLSRIASPAFSNADSDSDGEVGRVRAHAYPGGKFQKTCIRNTGHRQKRAISTSDDRMAVEFLNPLGRGEKPSNIPGGIYWLDLVVLIERVHHYSAAVPTPDF